MDLPEVSRGDKFTDRMSNPQSNDIDEMANQIHSYDSSYDPSKVVSNEHIDQSSWGFVSKVSANNQFIAQENETSHLAIGGYANNGSSGDSGNRQPVFIPRAPSSSSMHQYAGNGDVFPNRTSMQYASPTSPNDSGSSFPTGPRSNHTPFDSSMSGSGGYRAQQVGYYPTIPAQDTFETLMGYGNPAYGYNTGHAVPHAPNVSSVASTAYRNPQSMSNNINMIPISRSNSGNQSFQVKYPSYEVDPALYDHGLGLRDARNEIQDSGQKLPTSYSNSQSRNWSGPGSSNYNLGQGHTMPMEEPDINYNYYEQSSSMAPPPSTQNRAIRRSDLHEMHPDYVAGNKEYDDDEESSSELERDFESEEEDITPENIRSSRPTSSNSSPAKYQALIKSEKEFETLSAKRVQNLQRVVGGHKSSHPTNEDEKLACIESLFDAIMNTAANIVDKRAHDGRKAQAARRLDDGHYTPRVIEYACWQIFTKCKMATHGNTLVAPYHGCKHESRHHHLSFMHRWESIVGACKHSKAVCKQILDPSYMDRLVDAPDAQYKMKLNNKKINAERDKQNKLGRAAMNAGVQVDDLPNADDDIVITPSRKADNQMRRSSVKRRKTAVVKPESSDEDDYENIYFETPVKASHHTLSSRRIRTPHKRTPGKAAKPSPYPEPTPELREEYIHQIYVLLGVQPRTADEFTLEQLRLFARAYHGDRIDDAWFDQSFTNGEFCTGFMFHNDKFHSHFCHSTAFSAFTALAIQRGELNNDGSYRPQHETVFYTVKDDLRRKQILGIAPNTFGMENYSLPPPQDNPFS